MSRPAGVTASAVVCIIGSLMALMFASLIVTVAVTQPSDVPNFRTIGIVVGGAAAALAVVGVATAIALLRMRRWARTSALVLGGVVASFSALSLVIVSFMPLENPPSVPAPFASGIRATIIAVYLVPLGIGVWWLIYFNRRRTKAAFEAAADAPMESARPLSISIMGWASLVGGCVTLLAVSSSFPAYLFGMVLAGWSARIVYALFAAVSLYIGWGLLRLRERARIVALAWCGLTVAHAAFMLVVPAARGRMLSIARASAQPTPLHFDQSSVVVSMMLATIALTALAAWYLVRTRPAFTSDAA